MNCERGSSEKRRTRLDAGNHDISEGLETAKNATQPESTRGQGGEKMSVLTLAACTLKRVHCCCAIPFGKDWVECGQLAMQVSAKRGEFRPTHQNTGIPLSSYAPPKKHLEEGLYRVHALPDLIRRDGPEDLVHSSDRDEVARMASFLRVFTEPGPTPRS